MGFYRIFFRTHLKKVFSPDIGVETSPQVLDIRQYACGLILGFALISSKNPNFEMSSIAMIGIIRISGFKTSDRV